MLDIRREALEKALDFSLKELGFKAQIQVTDILKPDYLKGKYDIALMYGFSASHFNPWGDGENTFINPRNNSRRWNTINGGKG